MRCCLLVGLFGCTNTLDPVVMSQTTSTEITGGVACRQGDEFIDDYRYRAFELADHGVGGTLEIERVSFGVLRALANDATAIQSAEVAIFAYRGEVGGETLDTTKAERLTDVAVSIPDTSVPLAIDVPIRATIARPTRAMLIRIFSPQGNAGRQYRLGTNDRGETRPSYTRCGQTVPTSLGIADAHVVLTVSGYEQIDLEQQPPITID